MQLMKQLCLILVATCLATRPGKKQGRQVQQQWQSRQEQEQKVSKRGPLRRRDPVVELGKSLPGGLTTST